MMTCSLGLGKTFTLHHLGPVQLLVHHLGPVLLLIHHCLRFLLALLARHLLPVPLLIRGQLLRNLGGAGMA